jgi:hypothetical protein
VAVNELHSFIQEAQIDWYIAVSAHLDAIPKDHAIHAPRQKATQAMKFDGLFFRHSK